MTLRSSRSWRFLAAALLAATAQTVPLGAQEASLEQLIARMHVYLRETYARLANIVIDEKYEQVTSRSIVSRRLESEVLWVPHPVEPRDWLVFRDVLRVNGRPVDEHQQRLTELFIAPTAETLTLVSEINNSSLKYQIGAPHFALTNPYVVVGLLDRFYAPRLRFTLGEADRKERTRHGPHVIDFTEVKADDGSMTIFGTSLANGSVWLDADNGRILKTVLRLGYDGYGGNNGRVKVSYVGTTTTTFRYDEPLSVIVPAQMRTQWGSANMSIIGDAKYTRVRRFGIATEETLNLPTPTPGTRKSR